VGSRRFFGLHPCEGRVRHPLKKGDQITASTLFPFSQVTLAHTSRILQSHQIDVEVIGIESAT
jgi:hypothetical protein